MRIPAHTYTAKHKCCKATHTAKPQMHTILMHLLVFSNGVVGTDPRTREYIACLHCSKMREKVFMPHQCPMSYTRDLTRLARMVHRNHISSHAVRTFGIHLHGKARHTSKSLSRSGCSDIRSVNARCHACTLIQCRASQTQQNKTWGRALGA